VYRNRNCKPIQQPFNPTEAVETEDHGQVTLKHDDAFPEVELITHPHISKRKEISAILRMLQRREFKITPSDVQNI
jgi:hypothetical protein